MAYRPRVLLLDEPFSAMDYYLKERLRLEMAQVLRDYDGVSVLVTHDRDEAYQLCDYLLLMSEAVLPLHRSPGLDDLFILGFFRVKCTHTITLLS